jgi:dTDP-4-amino-4,6-dideoxygalactose transaminase
VADQVLSLPVHPNVTLDDVDRIARLLTDEVEVERV